MEYRNKSKGILIESYHQDGKKDSVYRAWNNQKEKLTEGFYKNGLKDGYWTEWLSETNAEDFIRYKYENGKLIQIYYYTSHHTNIGSKGGEFIIDFISNNQKIEKVYGYYSNGNQASEIIANYKSDTFTQVLTNWREDGSSKIIMNTKDNLPHGVQKEWDAEGNLILEEYYDMGKLIKKVK